MMKDKNGTTISAGSLVLHPIFGKGKVLHVGVPVAGGGFNAEVHWDQAVYNKDMQGGISAEMLEVFKFRIKHKEGSPKRPAAPAASDPGPWTPPETGFTAGMTRTQRRAQRFRDRGIAQAEEAKVRNKASNTKEREKASKEREKAVAELQEKVFLAEVELSMKEVAQEEAERTALRAIKETALKTKRELDFAYKWRKEKAEAEEKEKNTAQQAKDKAAADEAEEERLVKINLENMKKREVRLEKLIEEEKEAALADELLAELFGDSD